MHILGEVWDLVSLSYQRVFGSKPAMQLVRRGARRTRAIELAGWLYLYRRCGQWCVEVRMPTPLAFRDRPCIRSQDGRRTHHRTIDGAIVEMFLLLAHVIVHEEIHNVRKTLPETDGGSSSEDESTVQDVGCN